MTRTNPCPACGITNPASITDEHLMREYLDMQKASFDRVFGCNAKQALKEVAALLLARGITDISNIFGPIPVRA